MVYPVVARSRFGIENLIANPQTVFKLFDMRTHADALLKGEGVAIFHPHRPLATNNLTLSSADSRN